MKFCPYCGATLLGGAASFCAECGKPVPGASRPKHSEPEHNAAAMPEQVVPEQWQQPPPEETVRDVKKKKAGRKERSPKKEKRRQKRPPVKEAEPDPQDAGYDGYYDDVRPVDNGHERERMDPELIKRIALVGGGALLVIGFAIAMMLLL